jgi:galactonate dehydratase
MRITAIETLMPGSHPVILWVRVRTDDGVVGVGETLSQPAAAAQAVHGLMAPLLIDQDPLRIELHWHRLYRALAYHGVGGAELRALSAIDMALWDLVGKATGQPIHQLLGGACRDRVPIYNTCGSYGAIRDRERFLEDPAGLARELMDEGIRMMKIWPFDDFAAAHDGQHISARDLRTGVERVAKIREAVGEDVEIAIEGHALWNLPSAIRIARALEPHRPMWVEDLLWPENPQALAELRSATSVPVVASERLLTRWGFRELLERGGCEIVMFDPIWTGGLSEARRIATLASVHHRPIAPHNCGGPLTHIAVSHLCAHTYNLLAMETVRAFYRGFFTDLVTDLPAIEDGHLLPLTGPGLGSELRHEATDAPDVERQVTESAGVHAQGFASGDPWRTQRF